MYDGGPYREVIDIWPNKSGDVVLTNNGTSYIFDQTRGMHEGHLKSATPGNHRGWQGGRYVGNVKAEGAALTVKFYLLTDDANASGDWELDTTAPGSGGSLAVADGTTVPFSWNINGIGRAEIVNTGTPTDVSCPGHYWTPDKTTGA